MLSTFAQYVALDGNRTVGGGDLADNQAVLPPTGGRPYKHTDRDYALFFAEVRQGGNAAARRRRKSKHRGQQGEGNGVKRSSWIYGD